MPLNPRLYDALQRKFKNAGGVLIASEGLRNRWRTVLKKGKRTKELVDRGENYRVCCPHCTDTRHRCYVSYEFGVHNPDNDDNLFLVRCYNEECFEDNHELKRLFFYEVLYGKPITRAHIKPGTDRVQGEYQDPGVLIPLHMLDKNHQAAQYMTNRGYDLEILGNAYGLAWCQLSSLRTAQSRIIIPVREEGKPVGWLARLAQDGDIRGPDGSKIPKYYNMPGFRSEKTLYNWDIAKQYKTIILVEGTLDAIRVGPPAVALFGKTISQHNCDRILAWAHMYQPLLVLALDPDKALEDKQMKHHMEVAEDKLKRSYDNVMSLYLPSGTDPGSLTREEFIRYLRDEARNKNVTLDFTKHGI